MNDKILLRGKETLHGIIMGFSETEIWNVLKPFYILANKIEVK